MDNKARSKNKREFYLTFLALEKISITNNIKIGPLSLLFSEAVSFRKNVYQCIEFEKGFPKTNNVFNSSEQQINFEHTFIKNAKQQNGNKMQSPVI